MICHDIPDDTITIKEACTKCNTSSETVPNVPNVDTGTNCQKNQKKTKQQAEESVQLHVS